MSCRCGWNGEGVHPCHACGQAGGQERKLAYPTCLAGVQMKVGVYITQACDACWDQHMTKLRAHDRFLAIVDSIPGIRRRPGTDPRDGGLDYIPERNEWHLVLGDEVVAVFTPQDIPALTELRTPDTYKAIDAVFDHIVPLDRKENLFYGR